MFGRHHSPSAHPTLLIFRIDRPIAWKVHLLCYTGSFAVVISLWRRYNCMDSYWASTVDVSESPIASGTRGLWQQRYDTLHYHEEWWGSVSTSVVVFSWVHAINISSPKWTTVRDPVQHKWWIYRAIERSITSAKMYDAFQTFGKW